MYIHPSVVTIHRQVREIHAIYLGQIADRMARLAELAGSRQTAIQLGIANHGEQTNLLALEAYCQVIHTNPAAGEASERQALADKLRLLVDTHHRPIPGLAYADRSRLISISDPKFNDALAEHATDLLTRALSTGDVAIMLRGLLQVCGYSPSKGLAAMAPATDPDQLMLLIQHRHPAMAERQLAEVLNAMEVCLGAAPAARIFGTTEKLAAGADPASALAKGPLKDLVVRRYAGATTITLNARRLGQLNRSIAGLQAAMAQQRAHVPEPARITPLASQATG